MRLASRGEAAEWGRIAGRGLARDRSHVWLVSKSYTCMNGHIGESCVVRS